MEPREGTRRKMVSTLSTRAAERPAVGRSGLRKQVFCLRDSSALAIEG
jgi:hypothetical protein